jgi:hypothetical protein
VTDERLVAYIDLVRFGSFALYSMIIGHGEHLRAGVVGALHATIVREGTDGRGWGSYGVLGLSALVYAGMYQGGEGLTAWKRRALFEPARLFRG